MIVPLIYQYFKTQVYLTDRSTRALGTIDNHLKTHTYMVGERITVADIVVACFVAEGSASTYDAEIRAKHPHVFRLVDTILNNPKMKSVFPEFPYTEKQVTFVPNPKDPQKEKKAAPQKAEKKKAEKPKKKDVEEDDDDDAVPAEPKVKNPLDDLPKSTLNLEDWKRAYSNKETRGPGGAIEWFYEK